MKSIYKYIIAFTIGGFVLGFLTTYVAVDNTYTSAKVIQEYEKRAVVRDTLLGIYKVGYEKAVKEKLTAIEERDNYKSKLDTSFTHIAELSKPVVKKKDINEALKWIEEQNASVK